MVHISHGLNMIEHPCGRVPRHDPLLLSVPAALFVLFTRFGAVYGQEAEKADWQPYFRSLAKSYEIAAQGDSATAFRLLEPPVLRWSQPVRGGDDGAVYLWLDEGVPAAIGTMFCWPHQDGYRVVVNEFHSLLSGPLEAKRDGAVAWSPDVGGIQWTPFSDTPTPAEGPAQRLIQMRRLAGRFSGDNTADTEDGKKWELRLLTNPLYRYDLPRSDIERDVVDGALFTLASGTDPEVLILVEARRTADSIQWQYALARFSDRPLSVRLDEATIWSVDRARPNRSTPHIYFDVDQLTQPPAIATEAVTP